MLFVIFSSKYITSSGLSLIMVLLMLHFESTSIFINNYNTNYRFASLASNDHSWHFTLIKKETTFSATVNFKINMYLKKIR